jgi:hypothetical protein
MLGQSGPRQPVGQRWGTFIQNHANAIVACDFFTSVTATYHVLYIFVALGIGSHRIRYCNVTDHSTASGHDSSSGRSFDGESDHRNLIHDRDTVFSAEVDEALNGFEVLKTPIRSPIVNVYCELVVGWTFELTSAFTSADNGYSVRLNCQLRNGMT